MATLRKPKPKADANGVAIDEAAIYASITAFCCGPHGRLIVQEGRRLRGRDEAVQTTPSLFLKDPVTEGEIAAARHRVWPDAP